MAKSPNQKLKLLYLKQYLEEFSDEAHPISTAEIIEYLARQDISAERKSIYDDIETLRLYGVDVEKVRVGSGTGWYVASRDFQLPELKLLVDSVQSSRFITHKKSMDLIGKIEKLAGVHQAQGLRRQVWVKNRIKSMNESIYYNIDDIHAAIAQDRKISFRYFQYTVAGERKFRRDGQRYVISPYALLMDDENYYLIGFDSDAGIIKHFRVDKMIELKDAGSGRDGREVAAKLDMGAYTDSHFGMFSGDTVPVKLEFVNTLAGAVIDRFGREVMCIPSDENHFTVTVNAVVSAPFFGWLSSFGDGVKILAPESAVAEMKTHIQKILGMYTDNGADFL